MVDLIGEWSIWIFPCGFEVYGLGFVGRDM